MIRSAKRTLGVDLPVGGIREIELTGGFPKWFARTILVSPASDQTGGG
jgi:hypothetical protein